MSLPASAYAALDLPPEVVRALTQPKPEPPSIASPNVLQNEQASAQRLGPDETSITLYAELLLNIRTITLFASLRTVYTRETKAKLATDGCAMTVTHEGQSATIRLPIQVEGGGDAALSLPAKPPSKDLTLRLQVEEKEGTDLLGSLQSEERRVNIVPWDGATLNDLKDIEIHCKSCQGVIVSSGKIGEWRDLPNENWAEMMDFWHCHKPDEHHLHDHKHDEVVGRKGYAAGNRLQAAEGLGFVDLASFLLKKRDCPGVKTPPDQQPSDSSLQCGQCGHVLGTQDEASDGWRIWKWCIGIGSSPANAAISYSIQKWLAARLLFLVENQGVRKFHVHADASSSPSEDSVPSLLIWVFTPDLFFSSSIPSDDRHDPTRSVKIFYQHQTYSPPKPGEPESASIDDVVFPKELYEELERALKASQKILPANARKFQGWEVGLLERFDIDDVQKGELEASSAKSGEASAS